MTTPSAAKMPKKTLAQEIEAAADKLRKLQEKDREQKKREREKNESAVRDFIKDEKLETFSVEVWKLAASDIRIALNRAFKKEDKTSE